jgi:hypothetical protein
MRQFQDLQQLHSLVTQWGTDRNMFAANGGTYDGQWIKLFEEAGELAMGIAKKKPAVIKDSIGDMLVVCIMLQGLADRDGTLTNIQGYNLFMQVGVYIPGKPSTHLYFVSNELCWLSSDNTSTNYKGSYLQRMVSHLSNIAIAYGFTLNECLEAAYNEIKDRKGQMIDGVFIKEQDL